MARIDERSKRLKLAGLTWWRNNYGSILQAYALQEELNSKEDVDYEILCQYSKKNTSVNNLKDKLKKIGVKKTLQRIIWKFGLKKLRQRNSNMQKFIEKYLKVSENEYNEDNIKESNKIYDGFICGSDQIWNPKLSSLTGINWLTFANKDKIKISYAPSVGVEHYEEEEKKIVKKNLETFKAISSREETGTKAINEAIEDERCVTVLDPTLLVERTTWDKLKSDRKFEKKYIFVYLLRGTKKQRKYIEEFAKYKKLKIITMPFLDNEKINIYDFKFGDIKLWDASPIDFIEVIRNAEYVFTDSFHCMLFSTMYHRNYYTFPKIGNAQMNRILNFQKMIGTSERMINDEMDLEGIDSIKEIDWENVDKILKQKRKESKAYLENALKKE